MRPSAKKLKEPALSPDTEARNDRLTELCTRYFHNLVAYVARNLSRDEKDRRKAAEDIVAGSLLKVVERSRSDSVTGMAVCWRKTVDHDLRNVYRHSDMLRRTEESVAYEQQSISPSPESLHLDDERAKVLRQAIESLPPRQRMAFRLKEWQGLSTAEIVDRFAADGIEIGERQVLRYIDEAWKVCARVLADYEQPRKEGNPNGTL